MARTLRLVLVSIALLAHVSAAPSVLAAASFSTPSDQTTEQPDCCATENDTPDGNPPPESGDCCADGCEHCPLSCCGGAPALTGASPTVVRPAPSAAVLVPTRTLSPASEPCEIFRPPRV